MVTGGEEDIAIARTHLSYFRPGQRNSPRGLSRGTEGGGGGGKTPMDPVKIKRSLEFGAF